MIGLAWRGALDPPVTEQAEAVDRVWVLYLWISAAVVLLVAGLVAVIVVRFRRRSEEMPNQKHYNIPMEIAYTAIPLAVVLGLFGVTFATERDIGATDDEADLTVEVVAFQWQWEFTYPETGVTITGGADTDIPTLVLPTDSTVRFELESLDVIHSFWITAFRFKRDMIPGRPGVFEADVNSAAGDYPNAGVCAEYCGLDHAKMQFSVRILERDEFDRWLADQSDSQSGGTDAGDDGIDEAAGVMEEDG